MRGNLTSVLTMLADLEDVENMEINITKEEKPSWWNEFWNGVGDWFIDNWVILLVVALVIVGAVLIGPFLGPIIAAVLS